MSSRTIARGTIMTCSGYRAAVVVVTLTAVALASTGCTSMRRIPLTTAPPALVMVQTVKAGDTVSVEMKDGRRDRFKVDRVDGDALVSTGGMRYSRADIVVLKRRAFSPVKTAVLAAGTIAGAVFLAFAAAYGAALGSL